MHIGVWFGVFLNFFLVFSIIKLLRWDEAPPIIQPHSKVDVEYDENADINVIPELFEIVIIVIFELIVLLIRKVQTRYQGKQ